MSRAMVVLCMAALVGSVVQGAFAAPHADDKPYKLAIDKDATAAAKKAGFDLDRLLTRTADRVFAMVPHRDQIRINVRLDPKHTVPETGVGAIPDPGTGEAYLTIDDHSKIGFRKSLAIWLPASLARVLFLSSRIRTGPGYGVSLGEALVSEGLSDHFVAQAFPKTPALPWDHRAMTARQEAGLWKRAKPDLAIPGAYDHPLWFFGAGGRNALPRWSGFTLAYRIVSPYLQIDCPRRPSRPTRRRSTNPTLRLTERHARGCRGRPSRVARDCRLPALISTYALRASHGPSGDNDDRPRCSRTDSDAARRYVQRRDTHNPLDSRRCHPGRRSLCSEPDLVSGKHPLERRTTNRRAGEASPSEPGRCALAGFRRRSRGGIPS